MEIFNFPFHTVVTKNPESGGQMQFGNSYKFTSKPNAPDMRTFTLSFPAMRLFMNGGLWDIDNAVWITPPSVDITTNKARNAGALYKFYRDHKLWKTFIYPHPQYGNVLVKFNKPLDEPTPEQGGTGEIKGVEVELLEQPA